MSNYGEELTVQGCNELKAAGVVGVIVQAITGVNGKTYTRQQLEMAQSQGLRIQGYVWCFPNTLSGAMASRLSMYQGFDIEALWLDVEQQGLHVADVDRDLAVCDGFTGQRTGIYTARGVYLNMGWGGVTKWRDRWLWDAHWDGIADVDQNFIPYGGWDHCRIKQYEGESSVGPVGSIDKNVMR